MIRRTSQNSWDIEYASSYVERNEDTEVVATKEGIDVHGSIIPWAEIDEARQAVTAQTMARPKKNCPGCFGNGYVNTAEGGYAMCGCVTSPS